MTPLKKGTGPQKIYWTESMSVGVALLDHQHKELFCLVNDLVDLINDAMDADNIKTAFMFIEGYVTNHFNEEEELMRSCGYPGLNAHEQQHQVFRNSFENIKLRYKELGPSDTLLEILQSQLSAWLLTHVRKEDGRYAEFFKNRLYGLKG